MVLAASVSCRPQGEVSVPLSVPRGYLDTLQLTRDGRQLQFGPFVGYYFRPQTVGSLKMLDFVCFNERSFYTTDVPANAKLFEGQAVLTRLPDTEFRIPTAHRLNPIFFEEAPAAWRQTRPEPQVEYRHFHSCYSRAGAARIGYWMRHVGVTNFTYDMGGRVDHDSVLHHHVEQGVTTNFPQIMEFDHGPT